MRYPTSAATTTGPILALAEYLSRAGTSSLAHAVTFGWHAVTARAIARASSTVMPPAKSSEESSSRERGWEPSAGVCSAGPRLRHRCAATPSPVTNSDVKFRPHASSPRFTTRVGESGAMPWSATIKTLVRFHASAPAASRSRPSASSTLRTAACTCVECGPCRCPAWSGSSR